MLALGRYLTHSISSRKELNMPRTPVTRVNIAAKEPFGPCAFKDGGLAGEDFCKVKSGDRRVNW